MGWRIFTLQELRQFDGRNGTPAYIAYKGVVYDVTDSFLWKNGNHQVFHDAGMDLTDELPDAPHDASVLDPFPRVGTLATASDLP